MLGNVLGKVSAVAVTVATGVLVTRGPEIGNKVVDVALTVGDRVKEGIESHRRRRESD